MKKTLFLTLTIAFALIFNLLILNVQADDLDECKAAPDVAAQLLEDAGIDPRYGRGRDGGNYISDVARHMGPGTDFNSVDKCSIEEYENAIRLFLIENGINNIVLWLDAVNYDEEDLIWLDKSGQDNNAKVYGEPTYKDKGLNSLPLVQFDGENDYAITEPFDNHLNTNDWTILMVIIPDTSVGSPNWAGITHGTQYQNGFLIALNRFVARECINSTCSHFLRRYSLNEKEAQILTVQYKKEYKTFSFFKDNSYLADDLIYEGELSYGTNRRIYLMSRGTNFSNLAKGDIAEILIYNRALSEGERDMVEAYLLSKYNL